MAKRNKRNRLFPAMVMLLAIAAAAVLVTGLRLFRQRGSVKVVCRSEYPVSESLTPFRQDDGRWKEDHLGTSDCTVGSSGCVLTCIASAVSGESGAATPGQWNQVFSDHQVYDKQGNLQWAELEKLDGFQVQVFSDASGELLEECLEAGHYPIVRVRRPVTGSSHYILIVGAEGGEYLCMDTLEDGVTRLSDYGNRIYAVRCVWITSSNQFLQSSFSHSISRRVG